MTDLVEHCSDADDPPTMTRRSDAEQGSHPAGLSRTVPARG
jgi:hypothetical protein